MSEQYISIAKAAKLCSYDQEYLSLLARRGILKGKKVGRNWHTKISWLNEYLRQHRPEEMITLADEQDLIGKEIVKSNFMLLSFLKKAIFFALLIIIASGTIWWQNQKRLALIKEASTEGVSLNNDREILKVPNDQGNIDVYETRRIKVGEENIKNIID